MSSAVLTTTGSAGSGSAGGTVIRFSLRRPDFVVLAIALPIFLAAGWPVLAWGAVTLVWILQFALQVFLDSRVEGATDPKKVIGILAGGALARAWTVATALLILGLIDRETGVYGVILTMIVFTAYFAARVISRLVEESEAVKGAGKQ
ncbi:MAG: hypothetical protein ACPGWS_03575 [Solirubrobacterales bacterium]